MLRDTEHVGESLDSRHGQIDGFSKLESVIFYLGNIHTDLLPALPWYPDPLC